MKYLFTICLAAGMTLPGSTQPLVFISGKGDARSITSERIIIDGLIVFRSGQAFNARYEPAKAPYRSRTTDQLILNYLPGELSFEKGTVIAQVKYEIVVS